MQSWLRRKSIDQLTEHEEGRRLIPTLSWPHLIALGIGLAASKVAPFSLTVLTVAGPPLAIWAIGMVGAFIATRQITKVEPQLALGGIA